MTILTSVLVRLPCDIRFSQGDSGGPIIQYNSVNEPVVVGVVSYGGECAAEGSPGVYVRTGAHLAWMQDLGVEFIATSSTKPLSYPKSDEGPTAGADPAPSSKPDEGVAAGVEETNSNLGGGAIAGITISVLAAAVAALVLVLYLWRRRRAATDGADSTMRTVSVDPQRPAHPDGPPEGSPSALAVGLAPTPTEGLPANAPAPMAVTLPIASVTPTASAQPIAPKQLPTSSDVPDA